MKTIIESPIKTRGVSLWTALSMVLGLGVASAIALGALLYYWKADKARTMHQIEAFEAARLRADLEQKKTAQEAQLAQARNRQNEVLAQARHATNLLGRLLSNVQRLNTEASALRTNEAGSKVALHADLVATARRLYESELRGAPPVGEILSKLENARRIVQQMGTALGTTYEPDPGFAAALQSDVLWSAPELRQVEARQSLLTALVQEAHAKVTAPTMTPEPPTLDAALAQLAQTESVFRQRMIAQATEEAKPQAAQLIADAERERILQEARWQATNVVNEVRGLFEQQHRDQLVRDAEFQRGMETARLQVSNVVAAMEDMRRQHERDTSVRQAQQQVKEAEVRVQVAEVKDESRNIELRRKAQDPRLQALLAPFTTPGYRQPTGITAERLPFSYTQLLNAGALAPGMNGLRRLSQFATSLAYRERPRWTLRGGTLGWVNHAESIELVKAAQAALIELGPVMVELKMLAP